jgi:carboxyl-terminal processing protease
MDLRPRFPKRLAVLALALLLGPASLARQGATSPDAITETNITRVTASLLGRSQLAHQPLDNALAGAFLDRYLDLLDSERLLFVESDVAQFAGYRTSLARETVSRGDSHVAHAVFDRFMQRLREREDYGGELLKTQAFDFTGNDVYSLDRKNAARPRDLPAAQALRRQRLRAEYLQEKLDGKTPVWPEYAGSRPASRRSR